MLTLAFEAGLSAQLLLYPKTKTDIGVFATDGTTPDLKFIATKTGIKNDTTLTPTATGVSAGLFARPFLSARGFRLREYAYVGTGANAAAGTTPQKATTGLKQGAHAFELNIRGQATANLVFTIAGSVTGNGKASIQVDIDSNNKIDYTHTINGSVTRQVFGQFKGGAPRLVTVTVDASAGTNSSYDFTMLVTVEKNLLGRCHFSPIQAPCGKLRLDGIDAPQTTTHDLTFNATGGVANAPTVLFFGAVPTRIPIPNAVCPLMTIPVLTAPAVVSDGSGDAQVFLRVPKPLKVTNVLWQAAMFQTNGQFLLSQALRFDCL